MYNLNKGRQKNGMMSWQEFRIKKYAENVGAIGNSTKPGCGLPPVTGSVRKASDPLLGWSVPQVRPRQQYITK
jgi:hypothetical protein